MKIYTKTGDAGETSLFGGQRIPKTNTRIDAYGTVDELNSHIGMALSLGVQEEIQTLLTYLQDELFVLGADLATPPSKKAKIERISSAHITNLENRIDSFETRLEPLKFFVHPGGTPGAASLHVARTVCRRAERNCIRCGYHESINPEVIIYLNRLSDLLFILARMENQLAGIEEHKWKVG